MRALFLTAILLLGLSCMAQTEGMNEIVESYVSSKQFMGSVLVARGDQVPHCVGHKTIHRRLRPPIGRTRKAEDRRSGQQVSFESF